MKNKILLLLIFVLFTENFLFSEDSIKTDTFSFVFEGKRLSGTDSYNYFLESYLRFEGRSEPEIKQLIEEKKMYTKIFCTGGSYTSYMDASKYKKRHYLEYFWNEMGRFIILCERSAIFYSIENNNRI